MICLFESELIIGVLVYHFKLSIFVCLAVLCTFNLMHEKIDELMLNNPDIAPDISSNDPIGLIFGKEHPGRVKGLSYGACPTLAFKQSTTRLNGMNFASCSATSTNTDEKFLKMENKLTTLKNQMQTLVAYISSRDHVPDHFVVMIAGLVHTSINEVKFNILFNKLHKFIIIHM